MLAYNHERFIAQALAGVCMQVTRAAVEVVVGEDHSTDRTREVIADFQRTHPGRIDVLTAPRNLGMIPNFVRTLRACRGDYVALLEGDDYWTSPEKLQKQVDFLDGHRGCAICFHDAEVRYEDGSQPPRLACGPGIREITTVEDLLITNYIPTCSVMFRNRLIPEFPDWFLGSRFGDWPLHLLNARHGDIGYINEVLAVYRKHPAGAWATMAEAQKRLETVRMYEHLDVCLGGAHHGTIRGLVGQQHYRLARLYGKSGDLRAARAHLAKSLLAKPLNRRMPVWRWLLLAARLYAPGAGRRGAPSSPPAGRTEDDLRV